MNIDRVRNAAYRPPENRERQMNIYELTRDEKFELLSSLEVALYSAVDYVQFNGQQVKYRSVAEMKSLIRMLRDELGLNAGNPQYYTGPKRAIIRQR